MQKKPDTGLSLKLCWKHYRLLIILVAVKIILQYLVVNPYYELHRDEFLHLDQANHLAWGYISVPPFSAIISKLIFLLGGGLFWVRFFPALFGAMTMVYAWLITEAAGGRTMAKIVVSLAILFSVYARLNILFQPNSFDILVWTASFYYLIKFIKSNDDKWLLYLSLALAIGFYNKYTVVFLLTGIIAGILLSSQRNLFLRPVVLKAALLGLILVLPNLLWQVRNGFPVIDHMRVLKESQLDNNSYSGFLKGQALFLAGSLPVIISGLYGLFAYKPFRQFRVIAISFIFVLVLFTLAKAKDYYSLGLYPAILAFGAVFLEKSLRNRSRSIVLSLVIALNLIVFVLILRFAFPVLQPSSIVKEHEIFEKTGMLRWEDGKNHMLPQDFSDMTGWREMADKALAAYKTIPEDEIPNTLVFCDNYGQTGALNYYNRKMMKEAYSFNTDYIYWMPRIKTIKNVLLVGEMPEGDVGRMFRSVVKADSVTNIYAREKGTGIFLFTGADTSFTSFFYNELERRKKELDIF